jgi:hypothetical protein
MTKHNLKTVEDQADKKGQTETPVVFDVTSGGFLRIQPEDLIKTEAAKRQIAAVKRLSEQKTKKE